MKPQKATRTLTAYRIGDPAGEFPIWDATGSTIGPGRWNTAATPVIYASEHYSTAMLEKLVRTQGLMPDGQHFIAITIPVGTLVETITPDHLPNWASREKAAAQSYGSAWVFSGSSAILRVPSIVARMEWNYIFNPAHAEFARIETAQPLPVWWDERLFRS